MNPRLSSAAACAALLFLPFAARAQLDLTPWADRVLSDPNFLPAAGQLYGTSSYTHGWTDGTTANAAGLDVSNFHINTNTLEQYLAYGITDDVSVNASIAYAPANYREIDYPNATSASFDSSGFADPTFGATWRVFDQGAYPVNLDLLGSYTPDLIDAHTATSDQEGTIARGGQSGTIGGALGYETRGFGVRGAFTADFFGNSDTLDVSSGNVVRTQDHTNYDLSLETQTRLTDLFSVNAGIDRIFASNVGAVNLANGMPHTSVPGDSTGLRLALNYQFVPDLFVISATFAHDFYDNERTLYPNAAADTMTHNRSGDSVGLKLTYATP